MSENLPPPSEDLGKLLQAEPQAFRVQKVEAASMWGFLQLELTVALVRQNRNRGFQLVKINCINAVDYAIRPKPSHCLQGGDLVRYFEQHELLKTIGQDIPHTDGGEYFKPPIKFTLLELEDTYVIAERFEMTTFQPKQFPSPPA
jgi:hypothetical protein